MDHASPELCDPLTYLAHDRFGMVSNAEVTTELLTAEPPNSGIVATTSSLALSLLIVLITVLHRWSDAIRTPVRCNDTLVTPDLMIHRAYAREVAPRPPSHAPTTLLL